MGHNFPSDLITMINVLYLSQCEYCISSSSYKQQTSTVVTNRHVFTIHIVAQRPECCKDEDTNQQKKTQIRLPPSQNAIHVVQHRPTNTMLIDLKCQNQLSVKMSQVFTSQTSTNVPLRILEVAYSVCILDYF